jgi:ribose transport system permease protein
MPPSRTARQPARTNTSSPELTVAEAPAARGGGGRFSVQRARARIAASALLLGVVGLLVTFGILNDSFLTVDNFRNIFVQASVISVVAVPMALLLIAGKVDLSVGSTLALGGVTTGLLITHDVALVPAVLAGVGSGAVVGLVNGVLITVWDLSPIIVTLGALTAVRGLALTVAPDPVFGFGQGFLNLGEGELLGVPYMVLIAAAVFCLGAVVLAGMPVGRHIYAIGVNPEAAYLSGVRVGRIGLILFVATGAAAGLAGVMLAARLGSAPSGALGVGFELDVLTAVILGGVAFSGGRGTIAGVFLGVIFLGVLQNGLTLEDVPSATAQMVKGAVLVVAAALDLIAVRSATSGTGVVAPLLAGRDRPAGTRGDAVSGGAG